MSSINTFTFAGNLTKDVVLRTIAGGKSMATYVVAVDATYIDKDGKKHEACDFIPVTTYGTQAENDSKFLKKGSSVVVHARVRSWYKAAEKKGGFNFEAKEVMYMGGHLAGNANTSTIPSETRSDELTEGKQGDVPLSEHEEWVRHYAEAEKNELAPGQAVRRRQNR
jgi:single-strand DNA-binding protein